MSFLEDGSGADHYLSIAGPWRAAAQAAGIEQCRAYRGGGQSGHAHASVFPVARDTPDAIVGVVQARDLLAQYLKGEPIDVEAVLRPAQFVPEGMSLLDVLERLRDSHSQIALVIGEYGGFQGLVASAGQDTPDA